MSTHGHILIRRPPEVVLDFVADERNTYDPSIHDAELLTGEPIGAGTRFRCITTGRRPVGMTVEIVEYDRPHLLGTVTRLAGMDIASTLEFATRPRGPRGPTSARLPRNTPSTPSPATSKGASNVLSWRVICPFRTATASPMLQPRPARRRSCRDRALTSDDAPSAQP